MVCEISQKIKEDMNMKGISTYIDEKLKFTKDFKVQGRITVYDRADLIRIIKERRHKDGETCNLNDIDTSAIWNMSELFFSAGCTTFNGDVSEWDVSNVTDMGDMFYGCMHFNCDISKWNVSKVRYMSGMFQGCGRFNQDLSEWDVRNVVSMDEMFRDCVRLQQDFTKWDAPKLKYMEGMFEGCDAMKKFPTWYKS